LAFTGVGKTRRHEKRNKGFKEKNSTSESSLQANLPLRQKGRGKTDAKPSLYKKTPVKNAPRYREGGSAQEEEKNQGTLL